MTTFTELITLTKIDCGVCGGSYAINERYREQKYQVGGSWHCPYCETSWGYANNSENSRLKKELEQTQTALRSAKCDILTERSLKERALTDAARIKNRVHNGVCPRCKRSFTNLRRHMDTKHPEMKNK